MGVGEPIFSTLPYSLLRALSDLISTQANSNNSPNYSSHQIGTSGKNAIPQILLLLLLGLELIMLLLPQPSYQVLYLTVLMLSKELLMYGRQHST
jgi:hypothetical protein